MLLFFISFILPLAAGFLLTLFLLSEKGIIKGHHILLALPMSVGLGLGMASCVAFVGLLFFESMSGAYLLYDLIFFVLLNGGLLCWLMKKQSSYRIAWRKDTTRFSLVHWILLLVCTSILIMSGLTVLAYSKVQPFGVGDGLTIVNIRAKFMFCGDSHWKTMFLLKWNHPEYPLLLPGIVARSWAYAGQVTFLGPVLVSMLFIYSTIAMLGLALSRMASRTLGFLACILLAGTPEFVQVGACQYADVPFSFFILAVMTLLCLQKESSLKSMMLVGIMAALAVWTKNEGALLLFGVVFLGFCHLIRKRRLRAFLRPAVLYVAGALPIVILMAYFKLRLAPPCDIFYKQDWTQYSNRICDLSRYTLLGKQAIQQLFNFGQYKVPLVFLFLCFVGLSREIRYRSEILACLLICVFIAVGYMAVYIITPQPLFWHLTTSFQRLFLHLWPSLIFLAFLAASPPESMGIPMRQKS